MPIYSKDYFGRQKRLADQERDAMRNLIKIGESDFGKTKSYYHQGSAKMPGVTYYTPPSLLEKLLDVLKIKPSKGKTKTTPSPLRRSTGNPSGYI